MTIQKRQPFSPNGEYVARKPFRFHGKNYGTGDVFPWRRLSCSTRKLSNLYGAGYLAVPPEGEEETPVTETTVDPEEVNPEDASSPEDTGTSENDPEPVLVFDPDIHTLTGEEGSWSVSLEEEVLFQVNDAIAEELDGVTENVEIFQGDIVEE